MIRLSLRRRFSCFLIIVLFSPACMAESILSKNFDLSKLREHLGNLNYFMVMNPMEEGEKTINENSNTYRSDNRYHRNHLYVIEAIEQSMFGTHALKKHDIDRGEKWHRQAIRSLMDGKRDHYKTLQQDKKNEEMWTNLTMLAFAAVVNYKMGKAGYTGQPIVPTWVNLDVDISDIPLAESMDGYYGSDIRRFPVLPGSGFLAAIGRIDNGSGHCTGSLVSPRIALTNWHCVSRYMKLRFERLYETHEYNVVKYLTFKGWNVPYDDKENRATDWRNDWALLVLDRDVGVEPLRIQSRFTKKMKKSLKNRLFLAGYSGDLQGGKFLTADYGCSPIDYAAPKKKFSGVVYIDCRKDKGSSGSPILISGTDRIVSLNSFGYTRQSSDGKRTLTCAESSKCFGGGPDMSAVYKKLREVRKLIINRQI